MKGAGKQLSDQSGVIRIRYALFSILIAICLTITVSFLWSTQPLLSTSPGVGFWPNSASVVNRSTGLRLDLSVNSTSLDLGEGVRIRIAEHNTLKSVNSVMSANNWKFQYLGLGPCDFGPIGLAILGGYHSANDLPVTDLLSLYPVGLVFFCPADVIVSSYAFGPQSSNATYDLFGYKSSISTSAVEDFKGTWTGSACPPYDNPQTTTSGNYTTYVITAHSWINCQFSPNGLRPFAPGAYTVAGGDEWGDLLTLYFTVS